MGARVWQRLAAVVLVLCVVSHAVGAVDPARIPLFQWRARAVTVEGKPAGDRAFRWQMQWKEAAAETRGDAWSAWVTFDRAAAQASVGQHAYPNNYMRDFPVVLRLSIGGVVDPTAVEVEVKFDGEVKVTAMSAELYAGSLGLLVWREKEAGGAAETLPRIATMAEYNRRYWSVFAGARIPPEQRPRHFPIVERLIWGDADRVALREGLTALTEAGFSAIMIGPDERARKILAELGVTHTAWAVYNPPGYAFDFAPGITPEAIDQWAQQQAAPFDKAGFKRDDMVMYAMSDEPGWYYPSTLKTLAANPQGMERFRAFMRGKGLSPEDVGAASWDAVMLSADRMATDLKARRLFYWTMRFVSHDSSRHFAASTRALEKQFYPGMNIFTNWNNFSSRFYTAGPFAHNPDKTSPLAAMGGHDWLEFGRLRGGTMIWTEDWFSDAQAYQWSLYAAHMRSAAALGGVEFGAYVIPRTAGDIEEGVLQKILCVVGSGGKGIKYFVFGPEYNFPSNCYSENLSVLPAMAKAHRMIGAAEDVLWPGRPPKAKVGIVYPRSALAWDGRDIQRLGETTLYDATKTNLLTATPDYLAEAFSLYTALQHQNIPCDFIDEDDLTPEGLGDYRTVYLTSPNVPVEGQRGLVEWVKRGGVLATVSATATADRYDEPSGVMWDAMGLRVPSRKRTLMRGPDDLKEAHEVKGELGGFTAWGPTDALDARGAKVGATFADGSPAIVRVPVGEGCVVHYGFLPGLSYRRSAKDEKGKLPTGFSESLRAWVIFPTRLAGVEPWVVLDRAMVEAPLLLSHAGGAVTLLNWTGQPLEKVKVTVTLPFEAARVESVLQGKMKFKTLRDGRVEFTLPVKSADVVMIRPEVGRK